mgnify:CR=1 FL=1
MQVGDLFKDKTGTLVEVSGFWDKRDIDWECPESVAIIGMVKVIVLTGENAGRTRQFRRSNFRRQFTSLKEAM